jgi:hypothetical protein
LADDGVNTLLLPTLCFRRFPVHRKVQPTKTATSNKSLAVKTEKLRMLTAKKLQQAEGGSRIARIHSECGRMCPTAG